jgi:multiple sugar transport system substrate-binding protein
MRPADQFLARAYEAQAEAFNKKQSRIRARFDPSAGNDYAGWPAKLTTMLASDTPPDCFLLQQDMLPGIAASGALLVLDPLIARDSKEVDPSDFFPSHLEGGRWRGRQVALTPDGCAILEYFNLNLFQEAGVPPPKPAWTWNDYLDAARRLTKKDGAQILQAGIGTVPSGNQLLPWLWSNGADVFSPDFKQVRVAERAAVEAVQFVADLVQRHGVTTASPGASLGQDPTREGKVAMWRANRGFFGSMATVTAFKFNVVPLARSPQSGASITVTTPGHIGIARANKQPEAAWTWLKFLTSADALIIRSELAGGCPSRKSATQHPSYRDYTIPALESAAANKTFADVLADPRTARFVPSYVRMNDALAILSRHAGAAFRGEQAAPTALDAARRELEELLRQFPQPQS